MKILLIGNGGREHAIAWRLRRSPSVTEIVCPNGSPGIAREASVPRIELKTVAATAEYAARELFDLVVVGPEAPLAAGITDECEARGLKVFGPSKAAPWRAGANENTTISFSNDVVIGGKPLKAGTYGLFLALAREGSSEWIFSKNSTSWGSYFYNEAEDALRVPATPEDWPYTEYLTYNFDERKLKSAHAYLAWENKRIGFTIEVPNSLELYVDKIRGELNGSETGFDYKNFAAAAHESKHAAGHFVGDLPAYLALLFGHGLFTGGSGFGGHHYGQGKK